MAAAVLFFSCFSLARFLHLFPLGQSSGLTGPCQQIVVIGQTVGRCTEPHSRRLPAGIMATANPFMEDVVEMGIFMPYGIEQLFLGTVSAKIIIISSKSASGEYNFKYTVYE